MREHFTKTRRLYRSRHGIFFGVCAGIGKKLDMSPWGMRIVLILVTLLISKWTILLYIAAGLILKPEPRLARFERYGF